MVTYEYNGESERVFPTVPITVNKGDLFEGPAGLTAEGLKVVSDAKSTPAATASSAPAVTQASKEAVKQETKTEHKPSASPDITAGV